MEKTMMSPPARAWSLARAGMLFLGVAGVLLASLVVPAASPASAQQDQCGAYTCGGTDHEGGNPRSYIYGTDPGGGGSSNAVIYRWVYLPNCEENHPDQSEVVSCPEAADCPEGEIAYKEWRRQINPVVTDWVPTGRVQCLTEAELEEALSDRNGQWWVEENINLPDPVVTVTPEKGLTNTESQFRIVRMEDVEGKHWQPRFTESDPYVHRVSRNGSYVESHFWNVRYGWDFEKGTPGMERVTEEPEATYTFQSGGRYPVTVTAYWSYRYHLCLNRNWCFPFIEGSELYTSWNNPVVNYGVREIHTVLTG